jgi:toxin ParE1/3/4
VKLAWSAEARSTLRDAVADMATYRPAASVAWLEKLRHRVAALRRFARSGRIVPELNKPDHREIIVAPYRVIYRVEPKRVYVLLIHHGRRIFRTADLHADKP